jgi:hypothetical protein
MRTRRRAATTVALAVGVTVLMTGLTPGTGMADNGWSPLDDARQAAESTSFVGALRVQWTDRQGRHSTQLAVRGAGGVIHIDGAGSVVATADGRLLLQASGWSLVAPGDPSALGPAPPTTAKYVMTSEAGPQVAGRTTLLVDFRTRQGQTDERLFLDSATGLVMRREQLDGGQPVRIVAFTAITIGASSSGGTPTFHDDRAKMMLPTGLDAPFRAPAQLAAGYLRVGVLRHNGVVQVVYNDGLHSLSVFEQGGALDDGRLPPSGESVAVGRQPGIRYSWSGGQVITWQTGAATYTAVGDGPAGEVLAAAGSLPAARRLSVKQRLRLTCRKMLEEFTGRE